MSSRSESGRSERAIQVELRLDGAMDVSVQVVRPEALEDAVLREDRGDRGLEAREPQLDVDTSGVVEDLRELRGPLRVDQIHAFEIDHDRMRPLTGVLRRQLPNALFDCVA